MRKVILIAEDNEMSLTLVVDLIRIAGFETLEAANGKQAVDLARKHKPDLILMDIQMPVMDGLEATRILKADSETRGIPIIALTAGAMKGDQEEIIEAGCDESLTKPLDTRKFLEKVANFF